MDLKKYRMDGDCRLMRKMVIEGVRRKGDGKKIVKWKDWLRSDLDSADFRAPCSHFHLSWVPDLLDRHLGSYRGIPHRGCIML